jgi:hypothetical protein
MSDKPNCRNCAHRRNLSYNAHSKCLHPTAIEIVKGNPIAGLMEIMGGGLPIKPETLGVVGHPHGIRSGWFSWPVNFDPAWLIACNGFTAKASP